MTDGSDRDAVLQAFSAYSLALDRHEWPRLAQAFAPDGVWILADGGSYDGLAAITERARYGAARSPADRLHQVFNVFVSFDGDAATAESDWLYYGAVAGKPWGIVSFGHYEDRLIRTPDGWRFASRKIVRRIEYE